MAAILILAPAASSGTPIDIDALTGGVTGEFVLKGFDGADYMVQVNGYQNTKYGGGGQLKYELFADSGALPTYAGGGGSNQAGGGNYGGYSCDGPNKGVKWSARVSRSKKHLLCPAYVGLGNDPFIVKATFSDASQPPATLSLAPGGQRWWTCDWRSISEADETDTHDFEIRSTGPGLIRFPFMYITPQVKPYRPKGA